MSTQCAAFPAVLRWLSGALILALILAGFLALPELRSASWTWPGLLLFSAAWLCIGWMGYWLLYSRTRLEDDTLVQTWLWTKRVRACDVVQLKLIHLPALQTVLAPRLLVRQRGGAITWFHASDAEVLRAFMRLTLPQPAQEAPPAQT